MYVNFFLDSETDPIEAIRDDMNGGWIVWLKNREAKSRLSVHISDAQQLDQIIRRLEAVRFDEEYRQSPQIA